MDEDTKQAIRELYIAFEDMREYIALKCPPNSGDQLLVAAKRAADAAYDATNR